MTPATPDPEVALALLYMPAAARADVAALFTLDARAGAIVHAAREPMLAAIKLAWWRERIDGLPGAAPDEPLLQALAAGVAAGVPAAAIGAIVTGWTTVLDGDVAAGHAMRGAALFATAAQRLAGDPPRWVREAGALWALVAAWRQGDAALPVPVALPPRWPVALRPLGMLAVLAARDVAAGRPGAQGTPGRAARMAWHRISGR